MIFITVLLFFFFFKQKTAYEMRISDWSSDVCSSDLAKDVLVVSGASSVPCLTAAVIDAYLPAFARLDAVDYGISAAQHTNRGLATTSAVLSYVGKSMTMLRDGVIKTVYGWEDTRAVIPNMSNAGKAALLPPCFQSGV